MQESRSSVWYSFWFSLDIRSFLLNTVMSHWSSIWKVITSSCRFFARSKKTCFLLGYLYINHPSRVLHMQAISFPKSFPRSNSLIFEVSLKFVRNHKSNFAVVSLFFPGNRLNFVNVRFFKHFSAKTFFRHWQCFSEKKLPRSNSSVNEVLVTLINKSAKCNCRWSSWNTRIKEFCLILFLIFTRH